MSPLLVIAGPTGTGKSSLALNIALRFGGEIVNFDSVQVYRGFDIGSAKLPLSHRAGIPHHLMDICQPSEIYTAGDFARDARTLLPGIISRGRLPILCGGTGFYLRALLDGLSPVSQRNDALRADLTRRNQRRPGSIHKMLRRLDPAAGARIHPNDISKATRALELRIVSGRMSHRLFADAEMQPLSGFDVLILGLDPPRERLHEVLNRRCEHIWSGGLLDEVRQLLECGVPPAAKPFESLGYRQALQVVMEGRHEKDALEEMKARTRQYAKRQWTWFRAEKEREYKVVKWLHGFGDEVDLQRDACTMIAKILTQTPEHF